MRCEVRTDPTIQAGIRLAGRQDGATPAWPVPVEVRVPPGYSQPTFTPPTTGSAGEQVCAKAGSASERVCAAAGSASERVCTSAGSVSKYI